MSEASAAAWGATHGPGIIRRALDRGHHGRVVVPSVLAALAFGALGTTGALLGQPGLLLLMGLPAVGAAQVAVEGTTRWWWSRQEGRGPVVATAPTGRPATAWVRSRAALVTPVAATVLLWCWVTATVFAGVVHGSWWVVVVAAVAAIMPLATTVPLVTGAVRSGGLYLTEDAVVHDWWTTRVELPWDAVERVRATVPFALVDVPGRSRVTRRSRWWDWTDTTDRVPRGLVAVPPAYLPDPVETIVAELREHAHDPARRRHLGTARSVEWARRPR